MLKPKMLSTHGLVYGGAKKLIKAMDEIENDFKRLSVSAMSCDADGLMPLLEGLCAKLPDVEEGDTSFAVLVKNPEVLFGEESDYEGSEIENALEIAMNKGILVYFFAEKKSSIPDYIQESLESMINLSGVEIAETTEEPAETERKTVLNGEEYEEEEVPRKKAKKEIVEDEEYEEEVAPKKKKVKKVVEDDEEEEDEKRGDSVIEKAIKRSASSAVTSATRSMSTNLVNSITKSGKTKSVEDVVKQVGTTAISSFLRNIINGEVQEATKSKKKKK